MQLISWLAFAFTVSGCLLTTLRTIWCWPVYIVGNFLWAAYSLHTHQPAMLVQVVIFFALNIYGWRAWFIQRNPDYQLKKWIAKNFIQ